MDIAEVIAAAEFDEYDADMGTAGLCGTFALALKEVFPQVDLALICLKGADGKVQMGASDGIPVWKHVVALHDGVLLDVDGSVKLEHVIENYCWDNTVGSGGDLYPVSAARLREIVFSDNKSFDDRWFAKWSDDLRRARDTVLERGSAGLAM
ncbi:hypothetical protein [Rhizobium sp. MHM7A]|uniref:hypothetical protein n=1 Tax=Rhizobium sp. MHM7A TaxID=2583233 RepID=UPI0011057A9B|nr:hypothetical protein [Rhizobium sp. MHM7A]TLX16017.1 hypothetical protein FFR93_01480 [Rhizobium sp. MHM7A]